MFKNIANLGSDMKSYYPKISEPNLLLNGTFYSTNLLTSETKGFPSSVHFNKWTPICQYYWQLSKIKDLYMLR